MHLRIEVLAARLAFAVLAALGSCGRTGALDARPPSSEESPRDLPGSPDRQDLRAARDLILDATRTRERQPDQRLSDLRPPDLRPPDLRPPDLRSPDTRPPDTRPPDLCVPSVYYPDSDGDGDGVALNAKLFCSGQQPPGWSSNADDCLDTSADVHPGQLAYFVQDRGDGSYDYDCDGKESPEWTDVSAGYVLCVDWPVATCMVSLGWVAAVPACGAQGSWLEKCDMATCQGLPEPRTQACR